MAITRLSLDGYGARRAGSFTGKTETVVIILIGSPYTAVDEINASAGGLSEITGSPYTAVDGVEGAPT